MDGRGVIVSNVGALTRLGRPAPASRLSALRILSALAADRVLDAVAQLTRALNEESDFGSELLGAQGALNG